MHDDIYDGGAGKDCKVTRVYPTRVGVQHKQRDCLEIMKFADTMRASKL